MHRTVQVVLLQAQCHRKTYVVHIYHIGDNFMKSTLFILLLITVFKYNFAFTQEIPKATEDMEAVDLKYGSGLFFSCAFAPSYKKEFKLSYDSHRGTLTVNEDFPDFEKYTGPGKSLKLIQKHEPHGMISADLVFSNQGKTPIEIALCLYTPNFQLQIQR